MLSQNGLSLTDLVLKGITYVYSPTEDMQM